MTVDQLSVRVHLSPHGISLTCWQQHSRLEYVRFRWSRIETDRRESVCLNLRRQQTGLASVGDREQVYFPLPFGMLECYLNDSNCRRPSAVKLCVRPILCVFARVNRVQSIIHQHWCGRNPALRFGQSLPCARYRDRGELHPASSADAKELLCKGAVSHVFWSHAVVRGPWPRGCLTPAFGWSSPPPHRPASMESPRSSLLVEAPDRISRVCLD